MTKDIKDFLTLLVNQPESYIPYEFVKKAQELLEKYQPQKSLEERERIFMDRVAHYIFMYDKEFLRRFFDYWTELNESKTKFRFENEKFFDLPKRLARFKMNNKQYGNRIDQNKSELSTLKAAAQSLYSGS